MKRLKAALAAALLASLFTIQAHADFADGEKAYNKKNYEKAMQEWQEAAVKGDMLSENNIGVLYEKGLGVPQDDAKAIDWYTKAGNHGFAMAQFNLGIKYDLALGVPQDYKQAIYWYTKAAELGYVTAQHNLGILYANGRGTQQDYVQAAKWYTQAAKQCFAQAQINLWDIYTNVQGVPLGDNKFAQWYYGPKDKPVCVKVGNVQSAKDDYKLSPADYPKGIYVSVVAKPLWFDPIRYRNIEMILADMLKNRGFTIAENPEDASVTLAVRMSSEFEMSDIDKGQSDNSTIAVGIAHNIMSRVLGVKVYGGQDIQTNGVNMRLSTKMLAMEVDLKSSPAENATKISRITMAAFYSEDNYMTSTKLLILAFDEWTKLHVVENKNQPAVAASQASAPPPPQDTAQANPEPAKN